MNISNWKEQSTVQYSYDPLPIIILMNIIRVESIISLCLSSTLSLLLSLSLLVCISPSLFISITFYLSFCLYFCLSVRLFVSFNLFIYYIESAILIELRIFCKENDVTDKNILENSVS